MDKHRELTLKELDYSVSPEVIHRSRKNGSNIDIIGQPRALKALQFGIRMDYSGYNIFVTGESGTGRHAAVRNLINKYKKRKPLKDMAFVYNFADPDSPDILCFRKNMGNRFRDAVRSFISQIRKNVRIHLGTNAYKNEKEKLVKYHEGEENKLLDEFDAILDKDGFTMVNTAKENEEPVTDILPLYNGKPMSFEELLNQEDMTEELWEDLRTRFYRHTDMFEEVVRRMQLNKNELEEKLDNLVKKHVRPYLASCIDKIKADFRNRDVNNYLNSMLEDILDKIELFTEEITQETKEIIESEMLRYDVNVIVDNSNVNTCPVIYETHPSCTNLFGTIEHRTEFTGETKANFMMIKAGSLIKASGGFIIINAEDLFQDEASWEYMKRTLKSGEVQIQASGNPLNMMGSSLKPKAVKTDVKIILIGSERISNILYESDEDFGKFFKVIAEFDSEMDLDEESIGQYAEYVDHTCEARKLMPVTDEGIGFILKYGMILTDNRNKLSTRFSRISDLLIEGNYWAKQMGLKSITGETLKKAESERLYFIGLAEKNITDQILRGTINIQTEGTRTGTINALTVLTTRGGYSFGQPSLLTAVCCAGDDGIINIEHEAGLSGEIYDKAVMIIEGFIRTVYSDRFNMSFRASLCFEQSYGIIDGDSASAAEIYALLSAVTGVPLRQDIAVTGSVNQFGEIQAVGGVREKVAGFFKICEHRGLSGTQGVIIPETNIDNLLLPDEILEAVSKGLFHIYPIRTVNEGLEILTGMVAGEKDAEGKFPEGSFNAKAVSCFRELSEKLKENK